MKEIELLAPAKNLESGKVAINYGADAVYIGADKFGARAAASNSVQDIEELVKYAHKYNTKVYVTLNTILYNNELKEAEKLIHQIYNAGADALIIQDMGILNMEIPPIALHASTQTNNYNIDRIKFLDQLGFNRIVLARELSLNEIKDIRRQTSTELEFFIHGALCVSLSGQCYFSQVITGRSANRGMCAQMCRHPYNLVDKGGNKIAVNSHLLSLKDLNLSNSLKELIDAGITSLKIEGRLKDINYVKNVVSYYRRKLDDIFISDNKYKKSSSGNTLIEFEPDSDRSFSRQSIDYFLHERRDELVNKATPKSMGKKIGTVDKVEIDFITIKTNESLNNGDGLCFIYQNELVGVRLDKIFEDKLYISDTSKIIHGTELYRNYDIEFNKRLEADKSIRKIDANFRISEKRYQICFEITDIDGLSSEYLLSNKPEPAKDTEKAINNLKSQLSKSGNSIFNIKEIEIDINTSYFFPISELNEIRRKLFEKHEQFRTENFVPKDSIINIKNIKFPRDTVDFTENISNQKAIEFYKSIGVEIKENALEITTPKDDQLLMTTRYCIKFELGFCDRFQSVKNRLNEPLYLEDHNRRYLLKFDCMNCMMHIRLK